ncbi:DUF1028 domain-containing protein [Profundibacterium mesophilum]|uniref:Pilus assembly protein n=1 Tax=Profundibacterium mesophilum KAUST100406-0324 TaxID=1037889 RepID=A0A921NYY6_9RHOB|nr:DUF1028 domain-containing protein [Profundibacterium mesophilum]KAF0676073.1 hypothetical protein PMES_01637 [Profundibacterium mesophilum KAUST100406-0324]
MTYSIIAHDRATGEIGIAVASRFFACGGAVPYVGARCAVATQAFVNPLWGSQGRARLAGGESAEDVLADLVARDEGRAARQCHMMDAQGRFTAHTGADCIDWAGHLVGERHSVAGNMLTGPEVVRACFDAYAGAQGSMAERLLAAMEAGEAAGGDKRGRQAAGLTIHRGEDYAYLSLRVDDDADPLAELRRLLDVAGERYLHVAEAMPTAANFSGIVDRGPIDRAIADAEERRIAAGRPSQSRATSTET